MPKLTALKVCFIGIGSIATRHIKNLYEVCSNRGIKLTIDALRRTVSKPLENNLPINKIYLRSCELPADYDVIFLTNPTDMHMNALKEIHDKSKHFFIEKPIASLKTLKIANRFPYRNGSVYYVACPMRYIGIMQYLKKCVDLTSVIAVRSICSSYLPDWRPGTDYRECYSAHKDMGGGVSIDLIHEWDYLSYFFGIPQKIHANIGRKSKLEIDSDDYAVYVAEYSDKIIELHLDYFGRTAIREIMLIMQEDTIIGDFIRNTILYKRSGKRVELKEARDDHCKRELEHFLNMLEGKTENDNPPSWACRIMSLCQGKLPKEF